MRMHLLFIIALLLFCSTPLQAAPKQQGIGYSTGIGSPITTATTDLMTKGSWSFSHRFDYYRNIPISDLGLLQVTATESSDAEYFEYLMINYGLGEHVTLGGIFSYTHATNFRAASVDEEDGSAEVLNLGNISGISDSNFYAMGTVWDQDKKHPISMALLGGIIIPTGNTHNGTKQGYLFAASDQPGTGAWDPFGALVFSKKWDDYLMLSLNLGYTRTTEGTQDTTLGSFFEYNFAAVFPVYNNEKKKIHMDGILELNAWTGSKDIIAGVQDDNSGGRSIFFSPGIRVNVRDHVSFYASISAPLLEQYNGLQFTTNYGLISGVDVYF